MLDAIDTQYEPALQKGACWCLALQWVNAHNYGNANSLAIPLLDAVIAARLSKTADTPSGPATLTAMKLEDGWLGDRGTWEGNRARIARYAEYPGDKAAATWLPDRYVAYTWRSFVSKNPPMQLDAATSEGRLTTAAFKPTEKRFLIVPPDASIELAADVRKGTSIRRAAFYDGDRLVGEALSAPFRLAWSGITPGPHSVFIEYTTSAGELGYSNPVLVIAPERLGTK